MAKEPETFKAVSYVIPFESLEIMNYFKNIGLTYYKKGKKKLRKIFSTGYENLTTLIFYNDRSHKFILVVAKEDDPPLVLEKCISRAEAFRLMNTRVC